MKKAFFKKAVFMAVIAAVLLSFAEYKSGLTLTAPDGLLAKAREEMPIADTEITDLQIAGGVEKADGNALIWVMSGNENQGHYYLPMECIYQGDVKYEYVRSGKPMDRGTDIAVYQWQDGYAFLINNEDCKSVQITDETGTHTVEITEEDSYPFTFYHEGISLEYRFIDASGNELRG